MEVRTSYATRRGGGWTLETLRFFLFERTKHQPRRNLRSYLVLQSPCNEAAFTALMHFGTKSGSKMDVSWRYADLSMEWSRPFCVTKRVVHVHYVAIDDLVITTPLKKQYNRPLVMLRWSFAWLNDCANGDEADFTYVQTQKTQSLLCHSINTTAFIPRNFKEGIRSVF